MGSKFWIFSTVMILMTGGCAGISQPHVSAHSPLMPPIEINTTTASSAPYCPPSTVPNEIEIELPETSLKIGDLERFRQSISLYAQNNAIDHDDFMEVQKRFESYFFSPWDCTPSTKADDAAWPLRAFKGGYGSNLRPVTSEWISEMQIQTNFNAFGTLNQKGIAVKWMNVRSLPTEKPLYRNPTLPGEGYPFDLLQNSSINYGEPFYVSHYSKDGAWAYIFTNSISGWVQSDGIALMDEPSIQEYRQKQKIFLLRDKIPLYDEQHRFVTYSRIGMLLSLEKEDDENYYATGYLYPQNRILLTIPKSIANMGISKMDKNALASVGEELLKNTYGWGGMYGERDCSSMLRDMFAPFGIWLPRNSSAQSKKGEILSFNGFSNDEKLDLIKTQAIPFETIIYLKGHVLLYIGTYEGNVMVFHNIWGIRTIDKNGKKGRNIVGKAVISTLGLGSELEDFDPDNSLLTRAQSMNIFTASPLLLSKGKKLSFSR